MVSVDTRNGVRVSGHPNPVALMKTPMPAICLIVIFSGLVGGCATSPEAAIGWAVNR